jgi:DNA repair protein RadC
MKKNQIKKEDIIQLIKEEAYVLARKKQLHGIVKQINEELSDLSKLGIGKINLKENMMVGAHGFKSTPSGTGFVQNPNISFIAQLEKEMGEEPKEEEIAVLTEPTTDKPMVDTMEEKPLVDNDVKQQLVDMKEKIEVLLNSMQ